MTLKEGAMGTRLRVKKMKLPKTTEQRLEVVGMIEDTPIEVLNNQKKHGAMLIKVRGTRFALGKKIAENIEVEAVEP